LGPGSRMRWRCSDGRPTGACLPAPVGTLDFSVLVYGFSSWYAAPEDLLESSIPR
jgi:hypothetical protein